MRRCLPNPCLCGCGLRAESGHRGLASCCWTRLWRAGRLNEVARPGKPGRPVSERRCEVPGCGEKHAALGRCVVHYHRDRRLGMLASTPGRDLERPDPDEPDEVEAAEARGRIEEMRRVKERTRG